MRLLLSLLFSYLLTTPALAIYDLAAINITPNTDGTTSFCFQLDTSQKEMYLAFTVDYQNFLFLSTPSITSPLTTSLWQPPAPPPVSFQTGNLRPTCYGPFPNDFLPNLKLFAGVGNSFEEVIDRQQYLQIFDGLPTVTKEEKPWTVMVYMVGSTLEREKSLTKGHASKDILELLAGTRSASPNPVNVVLATGGSSREGWNTVKYSQVRDGQLQVLQDLGKQLMSEPQTLTDFVIWAKDNFPAQHHALILWNHGGGTQGYGQDTSQSLNAKMMSLSQLHQAYQTIREQLVQPLDIVIYDACVMSSIEVAEITSTVANAMAGSVEIEPAHGINYTHLLNQLATTVPADGITLGKIVKEGYIQQTKDQGTFNRSQITYSVLDLTQLPQLRETLGLFATELKTVFTDSGFLTTEMLSRGIIRAPGYPFKETGKLLRSLDEQENIRIDFYNILQTVLPEFPQLKSHAVALQANLQQLVVDYEANDNVKAIDPEAGRISLDIGNDKSYLSVLPTAYTQLEEALEIYNQKRQNDTSVPTIERTNPYCSSGMFCAAARWLELQAAEVINVDGYYGQQAESGEDVYLIKPLYRYQPLEESLEIGVNGHEACQYQLCVSDTECSNLTIMETHGLRLAEVVYNESPAILTLCPDDHANWTVCSVLPQPEGIWGREETLSAGDVITPTVLHLQDRELTTQPSQSLTVGETVPVVKSVCDMQTAVITASYFGTNNKQQFEQLCDKGDCVCQENDPDKSCQQTNFQFKAGVRIEVE